LLERQVGHGAIGTPPFDVNPASLKYKGNKISGTHTKTGFKKKAEKWKLRQSIANVIGSGGKTKRPVMGGRTVDGFLILTFKMSIIEVMNVSWRATNSNFPAISNSNQTDWANGAVRS
jgi:hypothetical protein